MSNSIVRINKIVIDQFKNVKHGSVQLNCNGEKKVDILGLYGQNGSGKTALINAISLLKYAITGMPVKKDFAECINVDADHSDFIFDFDVANGKSCYVVTYCFSMKAIEKENLNDSLSVDETEKVPAIYNERFYFSYQDEEKKIRKTKIVDTNTTRPFVPDTKYNLLIGDDENLRVDMLVKKGSYFQSSQSFLFSKYFYQQIEKRSRSIEDELVQIMKYLLSRIKEFGRNELFVIDTINSGMISMNALPLRIKYDKDNKKVIGSMLLDLNEPTEIPDEMFVVVNDVINSMNIVLPEMIPGLTIDLKTIGSQLSKNGHLLRKIEMMSRKNSREIPLKYESEGIKKIISILQLLIVMYNNSSITVAIDEIDSGIFEYLLGELLRIISDQGMGQLIFTSHNLRPLETIDKKYIAFTTTNELQRYIRLTNIKSTNNLRSYYFRDLIVNEQNEELYDYTNNFDISIALKEAGMMSRDT